MDVISGGVTIFRKARGKGKVISGPGEAYFDGYDNRSNLFVDGSNGSHGFALVELRKGSKAFVTVTTSNTVEFPGSRAVGRYVSNHHRSGRQRNLSLHGQGNQRDFEGHRFAERGNRLRRVLDRGALCVLCRWGQQRW